MSMGRNARTFIMMFVMVLCMCVAANITCPDCGQMAVPYPLSTYYGCGLPNYRIFCNNNQLQFMSIDSIAYPIVSIDPSTYSLVIRPAPLSKGVDTCISSDFPVGGLHLDESLPFNISERNTVMLFNCSQLLLLSPLNCTSSSLCNQFARETKEAKACKNKLCCTYLQDSAMTSHRIRVRKEGCSAYTSVVNINPSLPAKNWNYGVEIQWIPV
jgi:hypothetical protein